MRTVKGTGLITALFAISLGGGAAHATTWSSGNGMTCQADDGEIMYGSTGAGNPTSDDSSNIVCPLTMGKQGVWTTAHDHAAITYSDGNASWPFSCWVTQSYYGGSTYWSTPKYTCSNWGGCYDSTTSFKGAGLLYYNQTDMTSNVYNQNIDGVFGIFCHVPQAGPSPNTSSWIASYWAGEG